MPAPPARQTAWTTLPYGVGTLPPLSMLPAIAEVAWTGSSLPAGCPGGYREGAEDATTVRSAAIATTAVIAWWLRTGPVIAGTASVPSRAVRARPGCADWLRSPSTVPAGTPRG